MENKLFIPRGGQYQLILPDGTKVWLNSETTLTYPTQFSGNERKVKLIGEAYFEVAKNVERPFIVDSEGMDIKVLGTQFNVSSYKGASEISTTLIEGAVEVIQEKGNIKLVSGQQAYKKEGQEGFEKRYVNVDNISSWKDGYFSFDYQTLEEVMANISRWYNIEYDIIGQPKKQERLGGTFSRSKNLNELLIYLEKLVDVKITKTERSVTLMY
jgi:ferric-dicitrate binding protein FerR (iron transport regulator)